jgi:DNA mismatch endonuclease (patch repair protein)
MQATRRRDTPAELALRRELHARGFRYRVDYPPLENIRRRADIVFTRAKVAVFVDGCFWHGCPEHGTWPKQNADWWREKIEANRRRDTDTDERLTVNGWLSIRVWAHEKPVDAAERIVGIVHARRASVHTSPLDDLRAGHGQLGLTEAP